MIYKSYNYHYSTTELLKIQSNLQQVLRVNAAECREFLAQLIKCFLCCSWSMHHRHFFADILQVQENFLRQISYAPIVQKSKLINVPERRNSCDLRFKQIVQKIFLTVFTKCSMEEFVSPADPEDISLGFRDQMARLS